MKLRICSAVAAAALVASPVTSARAGPALPPYLDLPITQTVNRNAVIRYGVWVKVGERSVEAMIDTGSTGLRVLPTVFPQDFMGVRTDAAFGAGLHMEGVAARIPIEIGSLHGAVPVEVVERISCLPASPNCDVSRQGGDAYLIGGDGFPSQGYSAILGIGLPFIGTDLGNPLALLGAKRWIVRLPRPYDIAPGHLILDPDAKASGGFDMLARHGIADADGCIRGGTLDEARCGTVLFDTGAPVISLSYDGVKIESAWETGTAGSLSFVANDTSKTLTLDFKAGQDGGLIGVLITPQKSYDPLEPFILAGVEPFFTYDVLYDEPAHAVGLRRRYASPAPLGAPDTAVVAADGGLVARRRTIR